MSYYLADMLTQITRGSTFFGYFMKLTMNVSLGDGFQIQFWLSAIEDTLSPDYTINMSVLLHKWGQYRLISMKVEKIRK